MQITVSPCFDVPYWLCCGSLDKDHQDERARTCIEKKAGHPERHRFGTRMDHFVWGLKLQ